MDPKLALLLFWLVAMAVIVAYFSRRSRVSYLDEGHHKWRDSMRLLRTHDEPLPADIADLVKSQKKLGSALSTRAEVDEAIGQRKVARAAYKKAYRRVDEAKHEHKLAVAAHSKRITEASRLALVSALNKKEDAENERLRCYLCLRDVEQRLGIHDIESGEAPGKLPE